MSIEPDKHNATTLSLDIDNFIKHCDDLAGQWNGDNPGRLEDQASLCKELREVARDFQRLLEEFNQL